MTASPESRVLPPSSWTFDLASEADTVAFARHLAPCLQRGDLITLSGDLGAGKSYFARALIRTLMQDEHLDVPSPTFTLVQTYESPTTAILHCDFYRLRDPDELLELGFDESAAETITLVEWASHVPDIAARADLDLALALKTGTDGRGRRATVTIKGAKAERFTASLRVAHLLSSSGWLSADRHGIAGDASGRHFERLTRGRETAILMHAPKPVAGPPLRDGKSYRDLARLSDTLLSFVAVAQRLVQEGISAPQIYAADLEAGLALVEDFGTDGIVIDGAPAHDRYHEAAALLARLHHLTLPQTITTADGFPYQIPAYDLEPLLVETELFIDWYQAHASQQTVTEYAREEFRRLWHEAISPCLKDRQTWTLRDYHSPNLFWLADREGDRRIGVIDIQDTVYGHPAYDLASLLQDARVTIPEPLELDLMHHYADLRLKHDPHFDLEAFIRAYAVYGAQRATKILGIFVRLDRRDKKPDYLHRLPQMRLYLQRNLAHPALTAVRGWFKAHAPDLFEAQDHE